MVLMLQVITRSRNVINMSYVFVHCYVYLLTRSFILFYFLFLLFNFTFYRIGFCFLIFLNSESKKKHLEKTICPSYCFIMEKYVIIRSWIHNNEKNLSHNRSNCKLHIFIVFVVGSLEYSDHKLNRTNFANIDEKRKKCTNSRV